MTSETTAVTNISALPTIKVNMEKKNHLTWEIAILLTSLLLSVALLSYSTNGIRGSDQYWYIADVSSLADGQSSTTNLYYPGKLLRELETGNTANHFMHNGPVLTISAYLSTYMSPYRAWTLVNFICHLLVALSIHTVSSRFTSRNLAHIATALYLISPIAIWQATNILQEQFLSGITALCLIGFIFRHVTAIHFLLVFTLCLGILSHPIYLLLAIFYILFLIYESVHKSNRLSFILACGLAVLFGSIKLSSPYLYPSSFQPNLTAIIAGAIPGETNMLWHYSDRLPAVNASLLYDKLLYAIQNHIFRPDHLPLYFYTNIALITSLMLFAFRLKKLAFVLLPCVAALGAYVGVIVLMQLQPRYQQIVAPATFVVIAIGLHEIRDKLPISIVRTLSILLLIFTALTSGYLANRAHQEAKLEKTMQLNLTSEFLTVATDSRVLLLDSDHELQLNFALNPRSVIAIRSNYLKDPELSKAINAFKPNYFVSTSKPPPNIKLAKLFTSSIRGLGKIHHGKILSH